MGKGQQAGQGLISRCPPAPSPPPQARRAGLYARHGGGLQRLGSHRNSHQQPSHRPQSGHARTAPRPRAALASPSPGPSPSPTLEAWVGPAGALRGHRPVASASPWTSWATAPTMIILVAYRVACRVARRVVRRVADRVADRVVSAVGLNLMKNEVTALGRGWLACRLLPLETLRQARPGTGEVAERSRGGAAQESKRRRAGEWAVRCSVGAAWSAREEHRPGRRHPLAAAAPPRPVPSRRRRGAGKGCLAAGAAARVRARWVRRRPGPGRRSRPG